MPLCRACAEHLAFSRPDVVKQVKTIKQESLDYTVSNPVKFGESYIDILRRHLEWYERQVETASVSDSQDGMLFPLPWAEKAVPHPGLLSLGSIEIWNERYQRTYGQLRSSPDCEMCIAFLSLIEYETTKRDIAVESDARITTSWLVSCPSCQPRTLYGRVHFSDGESVRSVMCTNMGGGSAGTTSFLPPSLINIWLSFPKYIDNIPSRPRVPRGTSTEGQPCTEFLAQTLSDCLSTHPLCVSRHVDFWIATRLLDVSQSPQNRADSVVLVERDDIHKLPGSPGVQYFTLSYVWGKTIPAKLTLDNYSDRKRCIRLDELPTCFRDAVKMTRNLGGKYPWIDALW